MSAASQQQGLAESQDLSKFKEWEDPARSWIDLVAAFKAANPEQVRACLAIAKVSNWTHIEWTQATEEASDTEEDPEGDLYPSAQDDFFDDM